MATDTSTKYVRLNWEDEDGVVVVTPRDKDRFAIQLSKAINALQKADQEEKFREQFKLLLTVLAQWIQGRNDISRAYVTLRDGNLAFVVVQKFKEYNPSFQDDLAELDLKVARDSDLDLIQMNAISLPLVSQDAVDSFLDPRLKLTYCHGDRTKPHRVGK